MRRLELGGLTYPSVAVVMAFFSLGRKLWVDKTLRLKRQGKEQ
jgi:hypothetical protein